MGDKDKQPVQVIPPAPRAVPLHGKPDPAPLQSIIKGGDPYRPDRLGERTPPPRNGKES